ncbi:type IV pilus twitching motility protein PilT [Anaerospora sp.]|uniref:type IV pilus twitching motility protein PilT n=1 Tax=Anaerospora sp. TaxID=1960278 RepID=UPI00289F7343|nr:type IV pilus twitching motility protein PilT [Anaerospora sp.]
MKMERLLREAVAKGASDLHLTVGMPPVLRLDGSLMPTDHPVLSASDTDECLAAITTDEQRCKYHQQGELDFAFSLQGVSRFRINSFRQRGFTALAIRVIQEKIPAIEQLVQTEAVQALARKLRGLVLITGATGSGKSTTLAAMIDLINRERSCHIITLEDPIEYWHEHKRSIVNQREVNTDTPSFAAALRAALREDPDVILVGEMRDAQTMGIAITAAETGHLVLATLHTNDAVQTIDRIIDVFPPHQQQQIRIQLSLTLQGIVAQQLVPCCTAGGRVAAMEVVIATAAIRNLIREGKSHQMMSVIQTSAKAGMRSMDRALQELYQQGIISYEEALSRMIDQESFSRLINGAS